MELAYKAVRAKKEVPIWDLMQVVIENGNLTETDVGTMTDFDGEGPMATVRFENVDRTVSATTIRECLEKAKSALADLEASAADLSPDEDEDGQIAHMRMLENQAEEWAMRDESYGYGEYY